MTGTAKTHDFLGVVADLEHKIERSEKLLGSVQRELGALRAAAESEGFAELVVPAVTGLEPARDDSDVAVASETGQGFSVMPRTAGLAAVSAHAAGGLGRAMEIAAESPEAERGFAAQQLSTDFGAWLRRQREQQELTLDQLAREAGTTAAQISLIERGLGTRGPSLDLVGRLLWALGFQASFPARHET